LLLLMYLSLQVFVPIRKSVVLIFIFPTFNFIQYFNDFFYGVNISFSTIPSSMSYSIQFCKLISNFVFIPFTKEFNEPTMKILMCSELIFRTKCYVMKSTTIYKFNYCTGIFSSFSSEFMLDFISFALSRCPSIFI